MRHLIGVLEGHCERFGRDPAEITKTRLGTVIIADTQQEAERRFEVLRERSGIPPERLTTFLVGDPGTVAEKCSELIDAGTDGLIFNSPHVHELETVQLLGETLSPLLAERVH
jgi:alkanesulfonate monooxygenase SsuD/methylene tetrahydromethanopterin reductase-like flavin-dependent oxidoreductase (luciferase family)